MVTAGLASAVLPAFPAESAVAVTRGDVSPRSASARLINPLPELEPIHQVRTDLLDIAYHTAGPAHGPAVLLGHGWPYSPDAYRHVTPQLARRGFRVLVPYLRGHGPTRFRDKDTIRSGQQAALGSDVIAFMDALGIRRALFGGYDWDGRGMCVAAALWPERCRGLVSVNSYSSRTSMRRQSRHPIPPRSNLPTGITTTFSPNAGQWDWRRTPRSSPARYGSGTRRNGGSPRPTSTARPGCSTTRATSLSSSTSTASDATTPPQTPATPIWRRGC